MNIELNQDNAHKLFWVANMLEIKPEVLLNDFLIVDWLNSMADAQTGDLRALYEMVEYESPKIAKRVAVRVMSQERHQMGKDWGLPEIKVMDG